MKRNKKKQELESHLLLCLFRPIGTPIEIQIDRREFY